MDRMDTQPTSALFGALVMVHIAREGGFVDNPADPGGRTKYGISQRAYPGLDIAGLTVDDARAIYWRDYWRPAGCHLWADEKLAALIFDQGAGPIGPYGAVGLLQRAYNLLAGAGGLFQIKADGLAGPVTAAAINAYRHRPALRMAVKVLAGQHYIGVATGQGPADPQRKFLAGWLNRLEVA